jgi:succinate dehydrogenase flavin-adding protein (antitoxin of CptAB toxin-antitoxin module)
MTNQLFDSENIIAILGIQKLPDQQKLAIVEKISDLVQKRLLARVLESLSAAEQQEFSSLLENQDQAALNKFLDAKVPNFVEWLAEETNQVKQELQVWSDSLE